LTKTNWFLLLYKSANRKYESSHYEIGYFRGVKVIGKQLLCLHPKGVSPPDWPKLTPVAVDEITIENLLFDIYVKPPWEIKQDYATPEQKQRRADDVQKILRAIDPPDQEEVEDKRFTWTMRIDITPSGLEQWRRTGVIPDDAQVTGEGGWEQVMGKAEKTGAWNWCELIAELPNQSAWVPNLAYALSLAEKGKSAEREILVPRPARRE
jgi:hypothetical protein